jgi:L-lactate permease
MSSIYFLSHVSTIPTKAPSLAISFVSYEFPSLIGGMVGCLGTTALIQWRVGLKAPPAVETGEEGGDVKDIDDGEDANVPEEENTDKEAGEDVDALVARQEDIDKHLGPRKSFADGYLREMLTRTSPIWGVVVILVLTRVEQIGIKPYLTKTEPNFSIHLGSYGTFKLSVSGVFQLKNILSYPNLNWSYPLLYLPFIMPFVLVSVLCMIIFHKDLQVHPLTIFQIAARRMKKPAMALFGALVLAQLMTESGTAAPAYILGNLLADWFQEAFLIICPLLGLLGAFFAGSTTVSTLTFGGIQQIAAESTGLSVTSMLALQVIGGSAGNGMCINNIIAACTIVGLDVPEGRIVVRTVKYVLGITTIGTFVMLAFFFRFSY